MISSFYQSIINDNYANKIKTSLKMIEDIIYQFLIVFNLQQNLRRP